MKDLSKEQKVAFVLLMFLGFGGLILGFRSFGANIRRPFDAQLAQYQRVGGEFVSSEEREARELAAMKERDTDGDGLTDYDETFVYKTSPYLADTDSDGIDDKTEAFSGSDPNCPEGKDCSRVIAGAEADTGAETDAPLGIEEPQLPAGFDQLPDEQVDSPQDVINLFSQLDPEQLRTLLSESGVPAETLERVDDDQLKQILGQTLEQAEESGEIQQYIQDIESAQQAQAQAGADEQTAN